MAWPLAVTCLENILTFLFIDKCNSSDCFRTSLFLISQDDNDCPGSSADWHACNVARSYIQCKCAEKRVCAHANLDVQLYCIILSALIYMVTADADVHWRARELHPTPSCGFILFFPCCRGKRPSLLLWFHRRDHAQNMLCCWRKVTSTHFLCVCYSHFVLWSIEMYFVSSVCFFVFCNASGRCDLYFFGSILKVFSGSRPTRNSVLYLPNCNLRIGAGNGCKNVWTVSLASFLVCSHPTDSTHKYILSHLERSRSAHQPYVWNPLLPASTNYISSWIFSSLSVYFWPRPRPVAC